MKISSKLVSVVLVSLLWMLCRPVYAADLFIFHALAPDTSETVLDHSSWSEFLSKYIEPQDGLNYFRYGEVSETDSKALDDYLVGLQSVVVTELTDEQQFAYWVNLYNALTVRVILDHYPIESIRDISFGLLSRGPWKKSLVTVQNVDLSLDDIEHGILRPVYEDERIHYAVNCASIGCPNLQTMAFSEKNLESLLEQSARQYVNHTRGVKIVDGELIVSSIYKWYEADFGDSEAEVIEHLIEYASDELKTKLDEFDEIDDYEYDWSLNE